MASTQPTLRPALADRIIERLRILEGKLDDDGRYSAANTAWLAGNLIRQMQEERWQAGVRQFAIACWLKAYQRRWRCRDDLAVAALARMGIDEALR